VILTSGYSEAEVRGQVTDASATGFVAKPYNLNTLRAEIERLTAATRQPAAG
jgi:CheY-like chemotaxis protein